MDNNLKITDAVALLKDIPKYNLKRGQVGTIVEQFGEDNFEIEFCNSLGQTMVQIPLNKKFLLNLYYEAELIK